jgi:hypothetical protein
MSDPFQAAMRLLIDDRPSKDDVERAGELFEAASSQGHADASERCALFEAFGMARPQNWDRALDFLELAARQGSRNAQEQLLLLGDNNSDPAVPTDPDSHFWHEVRSTIDLAQRFATGEKLSLSDSPRIRLIKAFATGAECRWMIAFARDRIAPATVFDRSTGQQIQHPTRDNSYLVLRISEMSVLTEVIRNRIAAATRLPVPLFEPSQLLHYSVGQRFKPHHDFLDPSNAAYREDITRFGQRIATFLIYLNDGYSGGETSFPAVGLSYRGNTGDALFFINVMRDGTPDPKTLHAGLPPMSGEKWIFSQWIRDQFPTS